MCRKAIWEKNDSTRIYAWFSVDIVPSIGPEGFGGLPGAILGLATEDGGVIYFAKKVDTGQVSPKSLEYEKTNKFSTIEELKFKLESRFSGKPWGKGIVEDIFKWY
jgi:GLPGLI family protein